MNSTRTIVQFPESESLMIHTGYRLPGGFIWIRAILERMNLGPWDWKHKVV